MTSPQDLPPSVIAAGRASIRAFGMVSAPFRPLPDFLLIGAKRGGTTSLYQALLQHPMIVPLFPRAQRLPKANNTKGVHYFDTKYAKSSTWYRSHFPSLLSRARAGRAAAKQLETNARVTVGEASPYYLYHPLAAQRAYQLLPAAKILVILRDPVERTFSHYRERVRAGAETLTFEEALAAENDRLAGQEERLIDEPHSTSYAHEQQSYRRQSEYHHGLDRWLRLYPREQMCVLTSEDFYQDQQAACDQVAAFLGLEPAPLSQADKAWNAAEPANLRAATRAQLTRHFTPHNAKLEQLLHVRFNHWARLDHE